MKEDRAEAARLARAFDAGTYLSHDIIDAATLLARQALTRPPNDRGQGRKPIDKGGELMRSRPVRMTDSEWEKCKRLGGAAFLRAHIHRTKETK